MYLLRILVQVKSSILRLLPDLTCLIPISIRQSKRQLSTRHRIRRVEGIDARNEADSMVFQTEKALQEVGDKIDANDKAEVEADLNALKEAINRAPVDQMTDAQVEEIKSGKEKLMNSAQKLFAKVYEQAQQAGAGAGPNMGGANAGNAGSSKPDDDVVDADFKEV